MKVSIIVNNHNYGAYVCDAVDSALAQDHPDTEVVIVDDGSTDGSRERLAPYRDVADLVLKENGGQASALNAGFARAEGEAVIFLDSDDLLHPTIAAHAAALLTANPAAARVQFRMDVIDAAGDSLGDTKPPRHRPMHGGDLRQAELHSPFDLAWIPTSGNAFRAEALRRIFPIPVEYGRLGADWYVVHLTTLLGDVISLNTAEASYRVHGENGYELYEQRLDMDHLRRTIGYQQLTMRALARLADELGLERPKPILSMANVICRLTSYRLEPQLHPVAEDRIANLLAAAVRAAARRFDVSIPLKAMLVACCAAIALAPRPLARWLGQLLLFPSRSPALSRMSGRLHHRSELLPGRRG